VKTLTILMTDIRNCVVTGASGFVGQSLIKQLVAQNWRVRAVTRSKRRLDESNVEVFEGDLSDLDFDFVSLFKNVDVVFHCAGEIKDTSRMKVLHVDTLGRMLEAFCLENQKSVRSISWVQLSSCGVYGQPHAGDVAPRVIDENSPAKLLGTYETTKYQADVLLQETAIQNGIRYKILRPSIIVGPEMKTGIFLAIAKLCKNRLMFDISSTSRVLPIVHVEDVSRAMVALARKDVTEDGAYILSDHVSFERFLDSIGSPSSRMRLPKWFVRTILYLTETCLPNSLPARGMRFLLGTTSYSSDKLRRVTGFDFYENAEQFLLHNLMDQRLS
jgi:nucleoside-diphosphate-sugar epimerase